MFKYQKYQITSVPETMEEICFPKNNEYKLLPQQQFLAEYLYDNKDNLESLGILVYHEIGSGKTCTAINIAEKFKNELKIMVVLPASLIGNFRNELRSQCANNNYISNDNRTRLSKLNPSDPEYIKIIEQSDKLIDQVYQIYSYHKFVKEIAKGLIEIKNTLLIIDEVQNMVSMTGTFYKSLEEIIGKANKETKIVLLSATPMFDTPNEIALTLNLLKPKLTFPIGEFFEGTFMEKSGNYFIAKNMDLFKKMCGGLISYYRGDLPISYPKQNLKIVRCKMSDHQLDNYKIARKKETGDKKKFKSTLNFPQTFLIGSRIVSNIAFPNGQSGESGYESLESNMNQMDQFSCKFISIMDRVKQSDGPIFVYSTFLDIGGLKSLSDYLEHLGYRNFKKSGPGKKVYAIYSGDESLDSREKIKKVFNDPNNKDGSMIKLLLGSPSTKEGISLLRVNQVHVLEPHWNLSRIKQIVGRAIRYCSHKDLPEGKRYVDVYIYMATHQSLKQSVDEYIWSIAKKKYKLTKVFELALKEVAIDCNLFKKRNNLPTDEYKLVCDNDF